MTSDKFVSINSILYCAPKVYTPRRDVKRSTQFDPRDWSVRLSDIEDLPCSDVYSVIHGRWEHRVTSSYCGGGATFCSVCGYGYSDGAFFEVSDFNYCPNCGCMMRSDRND